MIAFLLYLIGLISTVVTVLLVGVQGPALYQSVAAVASGGLQPTLQAIERIAVGLNWALTPFLGGLLLMGFARIMMLLGSINRALKGPA